MARTALTPTAVPAAGLDLATSGVAGDTVNGNSYPWTAGRRVYVSNGDAAALTITVATPGTVGALALAIADVTVTVPAGGARLLPALGQEVRQSDGSVYVDWSGVTTPPDVTVLDL